MVQSLWNSLAISFEAIHLLYGRVITVLDIYVREVKIYTHTMDDTYTQIVVVALLKIIKTGNNTKIYPLVNIQTNGILLCNLKDMYLSYIKQNKSEKHHAKWKKPNSKIIHCMITFIWNSLKKWQRQNYYDKINGCFRHR